MRRALSNSVAALSLVLVIASACGGSGDDKTKTPSGARASCQADNDCALTNTSGCCAPCPEQPHAIPTLSAEQQKNKCAVVECKAASDRIECPKVDAIAGYVAKCQDGTCAALKK